MIIKSEVKSYLIKAAQVLFFRFPTCGQKKVITVKVAGVQRSACEYSPSNETLRAGDEPAGTEGGVDGRQVLNPLTTCGFSGQCVPSLDKPSQPGRPGMGCQCCSLTTTRCHACFGKFNKICKKHVNLLSVFCNKSECR